MCFCVTLPSDTNLLQSSCLLSIANKIKCTQLNGVADIDADEQVVFHSHKLTAHRINGHEEKEDRYLNLLKFNIIISLAKALRKKLAFHQTEIKPIHEL